MQDRQRLVDDSNTPRVTTNASFGGDDAVNAGVAQAKRTVVLPRVQQLARALAILDEAGADVEGDERRTRAAAYVADAESAYRFCPVQRADWWVQCFA
eukprot:604042-Pleurochrysis_carterae.AAC.1